MPQADPQLADLWQRATSEPGWPGPDCPPTEVLQRLVTGDADPLERRRYADHLVACRGCAAAIRELRALDDWSEEWAEERAKRSITKPLPIPVAITEPSIDEPKLRGSRRRTGHRRGWHYAALAAVLIAALGVVLLLPDTDQLSNSNPGAYRGEAIDITPAAGAVVDSWPQRFDWPHQVGASGFRARLESADGQLVWQGDWRQASDDELILDQLGPANPGVYLWIVEVRGGSRLGPFPFAIE